LPEHGIIGKLTGCTRDSPLSTDRHAASPPRSWPPSRSRLRPSVPIR